MSQPRTDPLLVPAAFQAAGVRCGIKLDPSKLDLALIASERDCVGVGVFTQNRVAAAPVHVSRERVPARAIRGIVANSGNANACTGEQGLEDARAMARQAAEALGCRPEQVLVCSTGIIGEPLPMSSIGGGIAAAGRRLRSDPEGFAEAARAIMTTDTVPKVSSRAVRLANREVRILGMAKGAAMLGPNMATMLAVLLTDARLDEDRLQRALVRAVDESFHCVSVEGHTSTNDTVFLLASGQASSEPLMEEEAEELDAALTDVCIDLARRMAADGEGAKHLITIDVEGARSRTDARAIARAIANSPLVKTAIFGADPNWGRIVSAAGYAGVEFAERDLSLWMDDTLLYEGGQPAAFDPAAVSERMRGPAVTIRLRLASGSAHCRFWTCDLTDEYIRINADYHT